MDNPLTGLLSMFQGGQPQPMPQQRQPMLPQGMQQQSSPMGDALGASLRDVFAGMAMGSTPQESMAYGGRMAALNGPKREQTQQTLARQNMTLQWLQRQGVDANTASYLISDPEALRTFFSEKQKAARPDYEIRDLSDGTYRIDKRNPSHMDKISGLKPDTISPEAEAQKIRMGQASKPETHITVGGGKFGTIPPGYELRETPGGAQMVPIPGGPADTSKKDQAKADSQGTSSDVITNAATNIRKAISSSTLPATGTVGAVLSNIGETGGAEVARQMAVLKSNATIESLNAMRQQSPTGGALGNVTQEEGAMLAAKAGTLDQKSPNFERDLADYERTLLRTIHGKQAGDTIFEQTRQNVAGGSQPSVDDLVRKYAR